jgi:hypothetical protein
VSANLADLVRPIVAELDHRGVDPDTSCPRCEAAVVALVELIADERVQAIGGKVDTLARLVENLPTMAAQQMPALLDTIPAPLRSLLGIRR